jgi:hypothetical protein
MMFESRLEAEFINLDGTSSNLVSVMLFKETYFHFYLQLIYLITI